MYTAISPLLGKAQALTVSDSKHVEAEKMSAIPLDCKEKVVVTAWSTFPNTIYHIDGRLMGALCFAGADFGER